MPGPSQYVAQGSVQYSFVLNVPLTPAALAAGPSTAEQTFTVPGLIVGDIVAVNKPTFQNTVAIGGARVSAANTLAITFLATAGTPTPTAESYLLSVTRHGYPSVANIPSAIA